LKKLPVALKVHKQLLPTQPPETAPIQLQDSLHLTLSGQTLGFGQSSDAPALKLFSKIS